MNPIAIAAALALAIPQAGSMQSGGDASATDVLSTSTDSSSRLTVPVNLGEHGPFRFLIDTGSQNTVIADTLVSRLALIPNARATLIGVAGKLSVDTVQIEEIVLGRRSFYGLIAPILDRNDLGAEGILGLDSLQGQRILIDFRKGFMAVNDARALGGDRGFDIVVTARRRSGQLIMTDATVDGIAVDVVIDTGSDTTLGNRALQKAMGRRGASTEQTKLHSVTGQELIADISVAGKLDMQGLTIVHPTIAYSDSPTFAFLKLDRKPAIMLGMREMRAFRRIAIDFTSRKVLFDLPDGAEPDFMRLNIISTVPNRAKN